MVIPGTQLNPYDALIAAHCCKAAGQTILDLDVIGINPDHKRWICQSMLQDWGICLLHKFQICVIHLIVFHCNRLVYLIAKTGSGKLAVPLTIGLMPNGITLTMVPLVGLGSNQVSKSMNEANCIKAYHLDKHRGVDAQVLRDCLLSLNQREVEFVSIFLHASPQSLQVGIYWCQCLVTLSSRDMFWLIVINEAHSVAQNGRDFWPEFQLAVTTLKM
jgi:superfamily II DNA helicase RecQ